MLTAITMVGQTIFMMALLFGRKITWDVQRRDRYRLTWREAARACWPHTLFALAIVVLLASTNPVAIFWFLPFLAGPLLSIPFAVWTTSPGLSALAEEHRFCGIPEDFDLPWELAAILPRPGA
jgi:membrane glycosyltransferase